MKRKEEPVIARTSDELLEKAFKRALTPETLAWINGVLETYDQMMSLAIDDRGGIQFARKLIAAKTRGFTLYDYTCMGEGVDAGIGEFYFGEVTPFMGLSHYAKQKSNPILVKKLEDSAVIKYIEFRGFQLGFASCNNDRTLNGELVLYRP